VSNLCRRQHLISQNISFFFSTPDWIQARTENGEACLHLTGIYGHSDVTSFLLENGADPNVRSTYAEGLRMHPLSWNIYAGHYDNIELLLKHGADVNLDFDGMGGEDADAVTAMDVIAQLKVAEEGDDRFVKLEGLLKMHGGMTRAEWLKKQQQNDEAAREEL
jgi:ankyrin repeat protein